MSSSIIASIPLDKLLGSLLVGSWISVLFFTIEIIQALRYFYLYRNDGLLIKCSVAFALATDLLNTVVPCLMVYKYCISHWGDVMYLLVQPIYFAIQLVSTVLSANVTQIYLTMRIWRLLQTSRTRRPTLQFSVMGVLGMFILALDAVGVWGTVVLLKNRSYIDREKLVHPLIVWVSLAAGTDVVLAAVLVVMLLHMRFTSILPANSAVAPVIQRLLLQSVETGCAIAFAALLSLALFLMDTSSNASTAVGFSIGKIYTLTLLLNLLSRRKDSQNTSQAGSGSQGRSGAGKSTLKPSFVISNGTGVHVSQVRQVDFDDNVPLENVQLQRASRQNAIYHLQMEESAEKM
ncbi:hypothetical protein T439DRAFT_245894 [Meredithblackwellia eburnea MCA 4105]